MIKGWYSTTTYIIPKKIKTQTNIHRLLIRSNAKLGQEKRLLQFANENVLEQYDAVDDDDVDIAKLDVGEPP